MDRQLAKELQTVAKTLGGEVVELAPPWPWETDGRSEVIPVRQYFGERMEGEMGVGYKLLWEVMSGWLEEVRVDRVGRWEWVTGVERRGKKENRVGVKTHAVET